MTDKKNAVSLLKKQTIMRKVMIATTPCIAGSVYFFGWRSLLVIAVACLSGFLTELFFCKKRGESPTESVLVTGILYSLTLPPTIPLHIVVIGMVFAIALIKEVFGGFGKNIFNPAIAARCFSYVCFPLPMTSQWAEPARGIWGALTQWTTASSGEFVTSATPMAVLKFDHVVPSFSDLLLGRIPGAMGVTSVLLILIGGIYLYYTNTANRKIIISLIASYFVFSQILSLLGNPSVPDGLRMVCGSGFLFGAFFMATDPISAPKTDTGRIIYGSMIAVFAVIMTNYSVFYNGYMFAILIGNMFAPIIDYAITETQKQKKLKTKNAEGVTV